MSNRCGRCGESDPVRKLYPPLEWVEYLIDERGLSPPEGVLAVPLCGDCHDRLVALRTAFREFSELSESRRSDSLERIETALDRLDVDALLDERETAGGYR